MELIHDLGLFFGSIFHRQKRTAKKRRNRTNLILLWSFVLFVVFGAVGVVWVALDYSPWWLLLVVPYVIIARLWFLFGRWYSDKYLLKIGW